MVTHQGRLAARAGREVEPGRLGAYVTTKHHAQPCPARGEPGTVLWREVAARSGKLSRTEHLAGGVGRSVEVSQPRVHLAIRELCRGLAGAVSAAPVLAARVLAATVCAATVCAATVSAWTGSHKARLYYRHRSG